MTEIEETIKKIENIEAALMSDEDDSASLQQAYDSLREIVKAMPELAEMVRDIINIGLQSDKNDSESLSYAYGALYAIVEARPELADRVLDSLNIGLQSDKNDSESLYYAHGTLRAIVEAMPELANETFDSFNICLQSDENDGESLKHAYEVLRNIVKAKPELADEVLNSFYIGLQSDRNDSESLQQAYDSLREIVKAMPELAEKVRDVINIGLQSYRNDGDSLSYAYWVLNEIFEARPDLADEVLNSFYIGLQSDRNDGDSLKHAYGVLNEIFEARPDLADKVFDSFNIGLQSSENYRDSLKKAYSVLRTIAAEKPELTDKVLDCVASGPQNDQSIYTLKAIVKHLPLEEIIAKYPKIEENLRVAHKCRFSTDDEVRYALQHLSKQKIINSTIMSAQQRTMNILVGEALREAKIDENEKRWYRTPDVSTEAAYFLLDNNDWLVPTSFRAAGVFGCYFPAFVKTAQKAGFSTSDIENLLPEPMSDEKNQSFRQFMLKHMMYQNAEHQMVARPLEDLGIIVKNWKTLKPEEEKGGYQAVLAVCKAKKYKDQRDDKFAIEAASHGTPESQYHNIEDFYLAGLTVPRPFDSSVIFKDKTGKYTARVLPPEDVRVGFFGEYTSCCQSFGGIGDACAVSTVKHPFSQLFVIEREHDNEKDKDKPKEIIAGSWIWENTEGKYREVCFDNIETIGDFSTEKLKDLAEEKDKLVKTMANRVKDISDEVKYKAGEHLWEDYFTAIKTLDKIPDKMLLEQEADIKHFKEAEQKLSQYMKRFENDYEDEYFVKQWKKLKTTQNEHLNCRKRVIIINDIYEQAGEYLAKEQNCRRVTIGCGRQDAQIGNYAETEAIPLPSLYGSGYTDARTQVLLAENPNATPLDKTKECPCYVRRVCFDDTDKMDYISEKCFPKGDRELADVENRSGFVVEDPHCGVVGYVIYDEQDKYISDMAVLEEYRTRKLEKKGPEPTSGGFPIDKSASNKLMFAMFEEIKKIGGTWSAHMRDRTSFKLLEFMEKRGRVKFSAKKEREMSDGSKVYEVSFHPIHQEAQKLKNLLHPKEDIKDDEQIERTTASRIITNGNSDER